MAMYEYTIAYRFTAAHKNADATSQLPLLESLQVTPLPLEMILLMEKLNTIPATAERIRVWTIQIPSVLGYVSLCRVVGQILYRIIIQYTTQAISTRRDNSWWFSCKQLTMYSKKKVP